MRAHMPFDNTNEYANHAPMSKRSLLYIFTDQQRADTLA